MTKILSTIDIARKAAVSGSKAEISGEGDLATGMGTIIRRVGSNRGMRSRVLAYPREIRLHEYS